MLVAATVNVTPCHHQAEADSASVQGDVFSSLTSRNRRACSLFDGKKLLGLWY